MSEERPRGESGMYHAGVWYVEDKEPLVLDDDDPIKIYCEGLKAKLKAEGWEP